MTARIFVNVAAYRDPDLPNTVESLQDTAKGDIRIGIVNQGSPRMGARTGVTEVHIHPEETRGAGWARYIGYTLREGEPWIYQCDSHIRMLPEWDELLIADYEKIGQRHVVLSAYPANFKQNIDGVQSIIRRAHFEGARLVGEAAVEKTAGRPLLSRGLLSASHLFAPSFFVDEVPYDPFLMFGGEEDLLALRAWTCGWDIWHPTIHMQWHDYGRHGVPRLWTDYPHLAAEMERRSSRRIAACQEDRLEGVYALGGERERSAYEAAFGFDFKSRTVADGWEAPRLDAPDEIAS